MLILFFSEFTFYNEALPFILFKQKMLTFGSISEYIRQKFTKHPHFKISSQDEVLFSSIVFFFFFFIPGWNFIPVFLTGMSSFRDGVSSRQRHVNSQRDPTIDRDYFMPRRVLSWDGISRVNTLLEGLFNLFIILKTFFKKWPICIFISCL